MSRWRKPRRRLLLRAQGLSTARIRRSLRAESALRDSLVSAMWLNSYFLRVFSANGDRLNMVFRLCAENANEAAKAVQRELGNGT